jgi:hypothetical protein
MKHGDDGVENKEEEKEGILPCFSHEGPDIVTRSFPSIQCPDQEHL